MWSTGGFLCLGWDIWSNYLYFLAQFAGKQIRGTNRCVIADTEKNRDWEWPIYRVSCLELVTLWYFYQSEILLFSEIPIFCKLMTLATFYKTVVKFNICNVMYVCLCTLWNFQEGMVVGVWNFVCTPSYV